MGLKYDMAAIEREEALYLNPDKTPKTHYPHPPPRTPSPPPAGLFSTPGAPSRASQSGRPSAAGFGSSASLFGAYPQSPSPPSTRPPAPVSLFGPRGGPGLFGSTVSSPAQPETPSLPSDEPVRAAFGGSSGIFGFVSQSSTRPMPTSGLFGSWAGLGKRHLVLRGLNLYPHLHLQLDPRLQLGSSALLQAVLVQQAASSSSGAFGSSAGGFGQSNWFYTPPADHRREQFVTPDTTPRSPAPAPAPPAQLLLGSPLSGLRTPEAQSPSDIPPQSLAHDRREDAPAARAHPVPSTIGQPTAHPAPEQPYASPSLSASNPTSTPISISFSQSQPQSQPQPRFQTNATPLGALFVSADGMIFTKAHGPILGTKCLARVVFVEPETPRAQTQTQTQNAPYVRPVDIENACVTEEMAEQARFWGRAAFEPFLGRKPLVGEWALGWFVAAEPGCSLASSAGPLVRGVGRVVGVWESVEVCFVGALPGL
ncbi:hypothetical protein BJY04DRAFT_216340 [Aspergillus karnatakaensis]|uniref:uncharacterized protein n=1 Tax=Aspergillus karnatakaensis TaxID=1810916 RepID=UPI003CCDBEC0